MNDLRIQQYLDGCRAVTDLYPVRISNYYRSLIREENDPVWKQCMPSEEELRNPAELIDDGLGENPQSPCARLIHRYPDRAVILATNACFMFCRFCFRKRFWKNGAETETISDEELDRIVDYLNEHREIKDLLLSGGDPLTLSDDRIAAILHRLFAAGAVETIRLCSRAPVVQPERITDQLADKLEEFQSLWFVTHFNHPMELTEQSMSACRRLQKRGIPVLNQTVLLAGVNNDPETLIRLFRGLVKNRIKPHYLFHADPIRGTSHFATGIQCGLDILRVLRRELASIATPFFAIDLPEGGGKVVLQPDYSGDVPGEYVTIEGKKIRHPLVLLNRSKGTP